MSVLPPPRPGVRHQSPSSSQEANWKHGQGVHSREAKGTADLPGLNYPAPLAFQLPVHQEVPGPQQLLSQLHRSAPSSSLRDDFKVHLKRIAVTLCRALFLSRFSYTSRHNSYILSSVRFRWTLTI